MQHEAELRRLLRGKKIRPCTVHDAYFDMPKFNPMFSYPGGHEDIPGASRIVDTMCCLSQIVLTVSVWYLKGAPGALDTSMLEEYRGEILRFIGYCRMQLLEAFVIESVMHAFNSLPAVVQWWGQVSVVPVPPVLGEPHMFDAERARDLLSPAERHDCFDWIASFRKGVSEPIFFSQTSAYEAICSYTPKDRSVSPLVYIPSNIP